MRKQGQQERVWLDRAAWKTILLDAHARGDIEACGVLLGSLEPGRGWDFEEARPLRNTASSPVYFEFDPAELLETYMLAPDRVVGVYHSHPRGPARASSIDRHNMRHVNLVEQIPWAWLIVSGPFLQPAPTEADQNSEQAVSITASGLVAYHHYQRGGLRELPIEEKVGPAEKPIHPPDT